MNGIKLFVCHGLKKKLYLAGEEKKNYEKTQKKTALGRIFKAGSLEW